MNPNSSRESGAKSASSLQRRVSAGCKVMWSNNLVTSMGWLSLLVLAGLMFNPMKVGSHDTEVFVGFLIFPAILAARFLFGFFFRADPQSPGDGK